MNGSSHLHIQLVRSGAAEMHFFFFFLLCSFKSYLQRTSMHDVDFFPKYLEHLLCRN